MSTTQTQSTAPAGAIPFDPVPVRPRHDGWTPERQMGFITALAATGCVTQAAKHVGMSVRTANDLYNRTDAASFRAAWDAALRHLAAQLATLINRAIHGTATPIFYKGVQVGERRTYDNRLGMWTLGRLDAARYGAWQDKFAVHQDNPDAAAHNFHCALRDLAADLVADQAGSPRPERTPQPYQRFEDDPEQIEAEAKVRETRERHEHQAQQRVFEQRMALISRGEIDPNDPDSYRRWQDRRRAGRAENHRASSRGGGDASGADAA